MPGKDGRHRPGVWKMALIVRGELRLTAGKAAVQAAHAAVMLVRRAQKLAPDDLAAWAASGEMKVALAVDSLAEMEEIERRARGAGLVTIWVEDAGFTEVPPGTRTCLGIGPARASELDPVTGSLPLL